eukprot:TRINITY_DN10331_c0_g1_i1.p1 TRINITY_DN10331_c0_g1~~TRINITY_DN10331_c0_g1_i1.p1  ORF type:complete len:158 (-),score=13.98 TRINITY_DN10331_c0_g1_i1:93-566(-)
MNCHWASNRGSSVDIHQQHCKGVLLMDIHEFHVFDTTEQPHDNEMTSNNQHADPYIYTFSKKDDISFENFKSHENPHCDDGTNTFNFCTKFLGSTYIPRKFWIPNILRCCQGPQVVISLLNENTELLQCLQKLLDPRPTLRVDTSNRKYKYLVEYKY